MPREEGEKKEGHRPESVSTKTRPASSKGAGLVRTSSYSLYRGNWSPARPEKEKKKKKGERRRWGVVPAGRGNRKSGSFRASRSNRGGERRPPLSPSQRGGKKREGRTLQHQPSRSSLVGEEVRKKGEKKGGSDPVSNLLDELGAWLTSFTSWKGRQRNCRAPTNLLALPAGRKKIASKPTWGASAHRGFLSASKKKKGAKPDRASAFRSEKSRSLATSLKRSKKKKGGGEGKKREIQAFPLSANERAAGRKGKRGGGEKFCRFRCRCCSNVRPAAPVGGSVGEEKSRTAALFDVCALQLLQKKKKGEKRERGEESAKLLEYLYSGRHLAAAPGIGKKGGREGGRVRFSPVHLDDLRRLPGGKKKKKKGGRRKMAAERSRVPNPDGKKKKRKERQLSFPNT